MKKAQAWSIDAMVGVFLFTIIVISVVAFALSRSQSARMAGLKEDGERVFNALSSNSKLQVIKGRKVDPVALTEISKLNYSQLKEKLGVSNDFCIYFIDEDGNLVYLDEEGNIVGIGSPEVLINGIPCNSS